MGEALGQAGAKTQTLNLSSEVHPWLGRAVALAYLAFIRLFPRFWSFVYDNAPLAAVIHGLRGLLRALEGGGIDDKIRRLNPDLVVCTQALSFLSIKADSRPLVGVVTDFGVHTYWTREKADLYIVAAPEMAKLIEDRGIESERVASTGIPVHPVFESPMTKSRARSELGLPADSMVILITGGHSALGPLRELRAALQAGIPGVYLLVGCGSDAGLAGSFGGLSGAGRLRAFTTMPASEMMRLMAAADLLVGKAGGLTCSEALAVGLPMLFIDPLPGQEERNCGFLISRGAALRAENLEELLALTSSLIPGEGALAEMARRAKLLGRPSAARDAARAILDIGLKAH